MLNRGVRIASGWFPHLSPTKRFFAAVPFKQEEKEQDLNASKPDNQANIEDAEYQKLLQQFELMQNDRKYKRFLKSEILRQVKEEEISDTEDEEIENKKKIEDEEDPEKKEETEWEDLTEDRKKRRIVKAAKVKKKMAPEYEEAKRRYEHLAEEVGPPTLAGHQYLSRFGPAVEYAKEISRYEEDNYDYASMLEEHLDRAYYIVYMMQLGVKIPSFPQGGPLPTYWQALERFNMWVSKPFYYEPDTWRQWIRGGELEAFFRKRHANDHLRAKLAMRRMWKEHYMMNNKKVNRRWLLVQKAHHRRWDVFYDVFENCTLRLLLAAGFGDNLFDIHKLFRLRAVYLNGKQTQRRFTKLKPGDVITIRRDVYDQLKENWKYKLACNMQGWEDESTHLYSLDVIQRMHKEKWPKDFAWRPNDYFTKKENHVIYVRHPSLHQFLNFQTEGIITERTFRMFLNYRSYYKWKW